MPSLSHLGGPGPKTKFLPHSVSNMLKESRLFLLVPLLSWLVKGAVS